MRYLSIFLTLSSVFTLTSCQTINLKEQKLSASLQSKVDNFLITNKFSYQTDNFLYLIKSNQTQCLNDVEECVSRIRQINDDKDDVYAAISEIYLAKAMEINIDKCSHLPDKAICIDQKIQYLDKSLRYSYVYLFKSKSSAQDRIFDYRESSTYYL